ncbi:polysaccharide lyase family 1 protein [Streptomyces sp. NPDC050400]|uniref:polysaccharide lyase family 1 protein n=1 Tax=Streptomyces sp. NPDC050400 TaxID=3365610 RepID=UPI0037BDABA9
MFRRTIPAALAAVAATLLLPAAAPAPASEPVPSVEGWAGADGGTVTGGAGADPASVWTVRTRAELKEALANHGAPTAPKIIRVAVDIDGAEADDGSGRLLGEQDYAPGYDRTRYMACFGPDGAEWSDTRYDDCTQQRQLRQTGSNRQKLQIQLTVPANTTLEGVHGARLLGVFLTVNTGTNIVVRDLQLEAPVDHFTTWSPDDGASGNWNARFDAMTVVTGSRILVEHCTFTDGRHPDSKAPTGFHGKPVQRHDGLLDIEDGSNFITVADSRFTDHDKALLIGSGDSRGDRDRGKLKITFARNWFHDIVQRAPRVRFGQVHAYNNLYTGARPEYALGVGVESAVVSERNVFAYEPGDGAPTVVGAYGGTAFHDDGSWIDGRPAHLDARAAAAIGPGYTPDTGWNPRRLPGYAYRLRPTAPAVTAYVTHHAGPRR